jgi:hypothetical protein
MRILELEPGATLEDAKNSYRLLVKVWHPDRFVHDPLLQKKAEAKLRQINLAYERICEAGELENYEVPAPEWNQEADLAEELRRASAFHKPAEPAAAPAAPFETPPHRPKPTLIQELNWGRRFLGVLLLLVTGANHVVFSNFSRSWFLLLAALFLIFAPLRTLAGLLALLAPFAVGGLLGYLIGGRWLGYSEALCGLIGAVTLGGPALFFAPFKQWLARLRKTLAEHQAQK